jgi:hypothetical protein
MVGEAFMLGLRAGLGWECELLGDVCSIRFKSFSFPSDDDGYARFQAIP